MSGRTRDEKSGRSWPIDPTWPSAVDAAAVESLRQNLELETRTLKGFRRRVRTKAVWSILGLLIGGPILLYEIVRWSVVLVKDADGDPDLAWTWFVDSPSVWWTGAAVVLLVVSRISVVARIRREHRCFRREGWVALQAPTGWVMMHSDGPSAVVLDHRSVGGDAQYRPRQLHDPVMLVSGPRMPVSHFVSALAAVRTATVGRTHKEDDLQVVRQQMATMVAAPAGPWFPEAAGCLLGESSDDFFTAAIPRPYKGMRRTRLGRIKLTKDETKVVTRRG